MIRLDRGDPPPDFLRRATPAREKLRQFYARKPADRRQERPHYDKSVLRSARPFLLARFHGKCAYCESPISSAGQADLENYRPKSLYWWLTYEWENLLVSCQACNSAKGSRFPLRNESRRAKTPRASLNRERPLLLDPCADAPEEHLLFGNDGLVYSDSPRGQATIDALTLNRPGLVEARTRANANALHLLDVITRTQTQEVAGQIIEEMVLPAIAESAPYAGSARQVLGRALRGLDSPVAGVVMDRLWNVAGASGVPQKDVETTRSAFQSHEAVVESFSLPESEATEVSRHYFAKRRTIERIRIQNFKALRRLQLDLVAGADDSPSSLMLLGENATGKSTVLKALALTLMGKKRRRELGIRPDDVLTRGTEAGSVRVWLTGVSTPVELTYRAGDAEFGGQSGEKVLLLGYGSTRLLPPDGAPRSAHGPVRVENLFAPTALLVDAEGWLAGLPKGLFGPAARILKELLPLRPADRLEVRQDADGGQRIVVRMYGDEISLRQLSDGYQSVVALAADILSVLLPVWKDLVEHAEGIVLIDELDAHLHPTWRMRITPTLRACFPHVQFITTTHDPLCLKGLHGGEVVVLRRSRSGRVRVLEDLPSPEGMSADQLLTSEHFGLGSTVEPEVEALFRRYYALLARTQRTPAQETRLEGLRDRLARLNHMGRTRREQMMLEVIDAFLAEDPPAGRAAQEERRNRVLRQLMDQWTGSLDGSARG
jgi:uncharacterized protein (TIGR02646 family)